MKPFQIEKMLNDENNSLRLVGGVIICVEHYVIIY